jgi:hypothetical protein
MKNKIKFANTVLKIVKKYPKCFSPDRNNIKTNICEKESIIFLAGRQEERSLILKLTKLFLKLN